MKSLSAFKVLYQEYMRKQSNDKTIRTTPSRDSQKNRSQHLRGEDVDDNSRLHTEESHNVDFVSGINTTDENNTSVASNRVKNSLSQASYQNNSVKPAESRGTPANLAGNKLTKDPEPEDETENFEGNIKGLLRKSRKQRETQPQEELKDYRQNPHPKTPSLQENRNSPIKTSLTSDCKLTLLCKLFSL